MKRSFNIKINPSSSSNNNNSYYDSLLSNTNRQYPYLTNNNRNHHIPYNQNMWYAGPKHGYQLSQDVSNNPLFSSNFNAKNYVNSNSNNSFNSSYYDTLNENDLYRVFNEEIARYENSYKRGALTPNTYDFEVNGVPCCVHGEFIQVGMIIIPRKKRSFPFNLFGDKKRETIIAVITVLKTTYAA